MRTGLLALTVVSIFALCEGCAVRPLSYSAPTPIDARSGQIGEEVAGQACASYILFGLISWGDGGYIAAVNNALKKAGSEEWTETTQDAQQTKISPYKTALEAFEEKKAAMAAQGRTRTGVAKMLVDVKADMNITNVLWIYQEWCTMVSGKAVR